MGSICNSKNPAEQLQLWPLSRSLGPVCLRNLFLDPATHIIPKALDGAEGAVAPQHRLNSIPAPVFFLFSSLAGRTNRCDEKEEKDGKT